MEWEKEQGSDPLRVKKEDKKVKIEAAEFEKSAFGRSGRGGASVARFS